MMCQQNRQKKYFPECFFSPDSSETASQLYMATATRENVTRAKNSFSNNTHETLVPLM